MIILAYKECSDCVSETPNSAFKLWSDYLSASFTS